ncbi:hypothetical protein [Pseudomonas syringae]|uniref:hypothetical protein n=1 Tax=Pseudomonas syringae TaxID=317 RepID=UPI0018E5AA88|nr:hypothetical protein [Pseudomonas syringae]MBI6815299.1 hypothetical protein [Pseudomonas syringae]MBI6821322.1 hypothetical protein [Pseudomonas syringae]
MNAVNKESTGHHVLLAIMGLGVWLPIILIALLFCVVRLSTDWAKEDWQLPLRLVY